MRNITLGMTGITTPQNAFGALPIQRISKGDAVKLLRRAYEGGYYVMAKIAGVKANRNVNGLHGNPYMLECHYTDPDTGVAHVWYSRYLYTDVTDLLKSDEVPVYTDRYDYSIGFVDVDAILPEIRVHG